MKKVLLTDYAWPDPEVECGVIEGAGFSLAVGPAKASPPAAIVELAKKHRPVAIMTCWAEVTAPAIEACPDLEIVQRIGVGLDNIDRVAAAARGAIVTNVPDYCVEEVSDHAVGMLLAWARGIVTFDREVKGGKWDAAGAKLQRVRDLTVGIAGFGRIGRRTAAKMQPFGSRVLVYDKYPPGGGFPESVTGVDSDTLLSRSDVVILHLPLTPETRNFIDAKSLQRMKSGSLLINVSRGGLVDNDALLQALEKGPLGAVALDVVEGEPNPPRALIGHPKVIATPHIAFASTASVLELRRRSAEEVVRVLTGQKPHHPCPPP
jgi:D-3-phosphoglycerate dehydrogenase